VTVAVLVILLIGSCDCSSVSHIADWQLQL